jgi:hypothetical protein
MTISELIISNWGSEPARRGRPILEDRWSGGSEAARASSGALHALKANPALGWAFANRIVDAGRTFPLAKKKGFRWINAAISLLLAEQRGAEPSAEASAVIRARELDGSPSMGFVLRAALMAVDATVELVATSFKLPVDAVEAYENLFFNILDRKVDFGFISKIVEGDDSRSMAFAREQAGVGAADHLLAIARVGTVQDVLVAAGLCKAEELSSSAASEALRQQALTAAVAWFTDPGNHDKTPPQLVALGLDLVKRMSLQPDPAGGADARSGFGALFASQFESDAASIRKSLDEMALESTNPSN